MTVGAFFDMDYTVLRGSSGKLYLQYLRQRKLLSRAAWARIMVWSALYMAGAISFPRLMGRLMTQVAGSSEAHAWELSTEWFAAMLRHYIADGARARVAWHRDQGHHVAVVSAATPYAVGPVAQELGCADAYLSTRLAVVDGRFTGEVLEPACYEAGKVTLTRTYASQHGIDLSESYFYSDSSSDLPLLLAVGHPVAVNPDRRLAREATRRGWPTMRFY
jgi:putative phosphoserine phosphatase / 1-acylglycerol-3-phosphate O-acyltransferase